MQVTQDEVVPAEALERLLGGYVEQHTQERHPGLIDWYPTVVALTAVSDGRGTGGGGNALPLNASALDFCSGAYWCSPGQAMPDTEQAHNPDNYRPGFEMTVLGLVDTVRRAMDFKPAVLPREKGKAVHRPRPDVVRALRFLLDAGPVIEADQPQLYRTLVTELGRLHVHVYGMVWGSSHDSTVSQCPHCYQVESVWSDGERAVCITPTCRTKDGQRHCWVMVGQSWQEVDEPDLDGRGLLTDDQLSRWTG